MRKTNPLVFLMLLGCFSLQKLLAYNLDVKAQGAKGDAVICIALTTAGSPYITLHGAAGLRPLPGMLILVDAAGLPTSLSSQDYVGRIVRVSGDATVEVFPSPGTSVTNARAILGSDDAPAFQLCVDNAKGSITEIKIPSGNYLLVPREVLNNSYTLNYPEQTCAAVKVNKGGIRFIGKERDSSVLLACGAWQLKGSYVTRGQLFECRGPIFDTNILSFENLTMDGGVENGLISNRNFPADTNNGLGWDVTHNAVMDSKSPLHRYKLFKKCTFIHWRGEMLKSVSDWSDGFTEIQDCNFIDGNASGFNFSTAHNIQRCKFINLDMALEFYQGYSKLPSIFQNNDVSNVRGDLVIVGAQKTHVSPFYNIINNRLSSLGGFGVLLGPAENVNITRNKFFNHAFSIGTGPGYQGTTFNNNILVSQNYFSNVQSLLLVQGEDSDRIENVVVKNNIMTNGGTLGYGWGYSSNVVFSSNIATGGNISFDGTRLTGQWFLDNLSNKHIWFYAFNYSGSESIITYAHGATQILLPTNPDSFFRIDDTQPDKIPPNAKLYLKCQGNFAAKVFLSCNSNDVRTLNLRPGGSQYLSWDGASWGRISGH